MTILPTLVLPSAAAVSEAGTGKAWPFSLMGRTMEELYTITPLVLRALLNYALEICEPAAHARYQSIVTLGAVVPFLLSPVVGWMVDVVGFEWVFLGAILLVLLSGWLTFGLDEPRTVRL